VNNSTDQPSDAIAGGFQLPPFDERAARRAIWRGVVRTAITGIFIVFAGWFILLLASGFWQKRGDREERFQSVIGVGFLAAHPDLRGEPGGCCNTDLTSLELFLDVQPQTAESLSPTTKAWLRLNILGRLVIDSIPTLPETPIEQALSGGPPSKAKTQTLLAELPEPMRASAVVELTRPIGTSEFRQLLERTASLTPGVPTSATYPPIFLESPYEAPVGPRRRLGWPNPETASAAAGEGQLEVSDPLTQFKAWAAMLGDGDDRNLERLGLPPADEIKKLAAEPKVHAFILAKASVETLRALLNDPAVRSVNVADVAFDLGHPDIE
jgi:hypothetical protein